jgi:hypothetical protein
MSRRDDRRAAADERQEERAARGDAGQLRHLEQRGFGECKEAKGLRIKLSGGTPVAVTGELEVEE